MTGIADLPPELLDHILQSRGISYCVINLWKAGNVRLNRNLSNGGATKVHLKDGKCNSTSRFPKMLTQLRSLRNLKIFRPNQKLMDSYELGHLLKCLSPTLEKLSLVFREAEQAFIDDSNNSFALFDENVSSETVGSGPSSRLWNIGATFPRLQTLNLAGQPCFTSDDLRVLPPSLTALFLLSATQSTFVDTSVLPRGLLQLSLGEAPALSETALRNLPPDLTYLEGYQAFNGMSHDLVEKLPQSITKIQYAQWKLSSPAMRFPENLIELDLGEISLPHHDWTTFIPPNLTKLSIGECEALSSISRDELRALPRTITRLSVLSIDWRSAPIVVSDFPLQLKSFIVYGRNNMEAGDWAHLPVNSITELEFASGGDFGAQDELVHVARFTRLRRMSLGMVQPSLGATEVDFPIEFTQLTALQSMHVQAARNADFSEVSLRERLPPNLVHVTIAMPSKLAAKPWGPDAFDALPLTLRALNASYRDKGAPLAPENFQHLARLKLRSCSIKRLGPITDHAIFSYLPSTLQYLQIRKAIEGLVAEDCKFLPRNLTFLAVYAEPPFDPSVLTYIPPTLRHLSINFSDLRDEHIRWLPRGLEDLAYRFVEKSHPPTLTVACVPDLPEHLSLYTPWNTSRCPAWQAYRAERHKTLHFGMRTPDPRVIRRIHGTSEKK